MKPVSCGLQLGWEVSAASGLRILGVWDSGVSENRGTVPYFGVVIVRILLFRVLYLSPLFSETPIYTGPLRVPLSCSLGFRIKAILKRSPERFSL